MGKSYTVKLARGSGDKRRIYDVKLRIPVELARKLGMKHGTTVLIKPHGSGFHVVRRRKSRHAGKTASVQLTSS